MLKRFAVLSLCLPLLLLQSGCATYNRIANYPASGSATTVAVEAVPLSKMKDLPVGGYYDAPRNIVVTGHQKGVATGMLLFGMVGVLVADQVNKSAGASKYGDDSARAGVDLVVLSRELLNQVVSDGTAPKWSVAPAAGGLRLSPYAVFTVQKSGEAHLHAMLRAEKIGADGKPTWSARYFVRAAGAHKLDGDDTWMTGGRFEPAMRAALQRAIATCVADTHGKLAGAGTFTAKGRFPYFPMDFELRVIAVQEDADSVVGRLAVGDALICSGTHVLDRADYVIKAAEFKDPRI
jgi:hypothetical protein